MDTTTQEMYERDDLLGRNKQRHKKSADQPNPDETPRRRRTEDLDDWL